jgi:uncharacterized protein YciI
MYFLVTEVPGAAWDRGRPRRQQDGWDDHAEFVDRLAEEGVIVLGGPLGDPDYGPALLVARADSEAEIRRRLADDPWMDTILTIGSVQPWSIWVGTLPG